MYKMYYCSKCKTETKEFLSSNPVFEKTEPTAFETLVLNCATCQRSVLHYEVGKEENQEKWMRAK